MSLLAFYSAQGVHQAGPTAAVTLHPKGVYWAVQPPSISPYGPFSCPDESR